MCVYSGSPRSSRGCFVSIAKKSKILTCNEIFAYIDQDTSIYEEIWKLNQNLRFTNENTRTVHSFHEFSRSLLYHLRRTVKLTEIRKKRISLAVILLTFVSIFIELNIWQINTVKSSLYERVNAQFQMYKLV